VHVTLGQGLGTFPLLSFFWFDQPHWKGSSWGPPWKWCLLLHGPKDKWKSFHSLFIAGSWWLLPVILSYSGGRDQEDQGLKPAWTNSSQDPILKKSITKKAGGKLVM
jgi:hypothetical protein